MAQPQSDDDYDPEYEKKVKRQKINHAARTRQRKEKRKQKLAAKEQKQSEIIKQKQEAKEQKQADELNQKAKELHRSSDWNQCQEAVATVVPRLWVMEFEQNPQAVDFLFYALFKRPKRYTELMQLYPHCKWMKEKWNEENMKFCILTMSENGNRLVWKDSDEKDYVTDLLWEQIETDRISGSKHYADTLIDGVQCIEVGRPDQLATGLCINNPCKTANPRYYDTSFPKCNTDLCTHEPFTCKACSVQLLWLILEGITKHGNESKFCVLKYAETKKMLNGYRRGLRLMLILGFLRSPDEQRFIWQGGEIANETVAYHFEKFANVTFCDCALTQEAITTIISAETQKEDKTDQRSLLTTYLVESFYYKAYHEDKEYHDEQAKKIPGDFRVTLLGFPYLSSPHKWHMKCKYCDIY